VLTYWFCDRDLQCEDCPLDAALSHDSMRLPAEIRERCSSVQPRNQQHDSREFQSAVQPGSTLADVLSSELAPLDPEARYSRFHTWMRVESSSRVRIGADPFAARIAGRLRCVVLLPVGTRIFGGGPCAWFDQPGGTLALRSPVSGEVLECNEELCARSGFELQDPLRDEWLLLLRPLRLRTEQRTLADAETFQRIVQQDFDSWQRRVRSAAERSTENLGTTLADGGARVSDLNQLLGDLRLHEIARRFLP
jgi:glycine cleavage system H protein